MSSLLNILNIDSLDFNIEDDILKNILKDESLSIPKRVTVNILYPRLFVFFQYMIIENPIMFVYPLEADTMDVIDKNDKRAYKIKKTKRTIKYINELKTQDYQGMIKEILYILEPNLDIYTNSLNTYNELKKFSNNKKNLFPRKCYLIEKYFETNETIYLFIIFLNENKEFAKKMKKNPKIQKYIKSLPFDICI